VKTGILFLLLLAIIAGAVAYQNGYWQASTANNGFEVQTVVAALGNVQRMVSTSGTVKALVTLLVGSQLSGQITELNADFNSEVKKNQVIARIDPRTFAMRVNEAAAVVSVAEASITLQEATLTRAKATLDNIQRELQRNQSLIAKKLVAESALDNSRAAYQVAKADVEIAQAQLENAKATLKQRQAALDTARIDLERTYIRSPIDGIVVDRSVDVGQTVAASLSAPTLFTIAQDLREVRVEAQVDEADIGQISSSDSVAFTVDAYQNKSFKGTIEQIRLAPTKIQNVVTYTVVVSAKNPDKLLLPGMTANVEIVTGERKNVLVLPNEVLRFRPNETITKALIRESSAKGGGAGRREQLLNTLKTELRLSPEELGKVQTALEKAFSQRPPNASSDSSGPGGGPATGGDGGSGGGGGGNSRIAKILQEVLSAEQFKRWQELQNQTRRRVSQVWVKGSDGFLVSKRVELGINDEHVTEVIGGDLKAGELVVTRVKAKTP
jgi:HlyD family secretion protein